jgi:hypothetical protein
VARKRKLNKLNHIFVAEWLGKDWYRDDQDRITDSEGTYAGDKITKILNEQYPPVASGPAKKSKETLEKAFPKTYEEPREKQRSAGRQKDQADKEAQEYKRDTQELRGNINAISGLMRENSALIRQQLSAQQRSITLLSEISNSIKSSGGGGGKGGSGLLGSLALGLGGMAAGGLAAYLMGGSNGNGNGGDEDEDEDPKKQPQQPPPQQSAAIQEAQNRGEKKDEKVLTVNAKEIYYNSDRLTFNVTDLTIDAEKIINEIKQGQSQVPTAPPPSAPPPAPESPKDSKKDGATGGAGAPGGAPGGMPAGAPGGNNTAAAPAPAAAVEPTNKPPVAGPNAPLKEVKDQAGNVIAQVPDYGPGRLEPRKGLFETLFGQSDEEKKAILAKTQDIEKNGAVSTAMGDIGMPAMPQGASEPPKPAAAPVTPAAKPKATTTTKTIMVDDPNWDRHAASRKMYEEATARENRGENSQSMYWAAEAQRKKELAASPPQIKKTIQVAAAAKVDQAIPGGVGATGYGAGDPLAQVSAERMDPETLGEQSIPPVQAIKDKKAIDASSNALEEMSKGARRAEMYDIDERSTQDTAGARQKIEDDSSIRERGAAGQSLAQQMATSSPNRPAATLRNAALANNYDVEGQREEATRGANRDRDDMEYGAGRNQGNSDSPDPVNKDQPMAPGAHDTHSIFDYLFNYNPGRGRRTINMGTN